MNYLNLIEAKKYFLEGGNVTEQLRSQLKLNFNDAVSIGFRAMKTL